MADMIGIDNDNKSLSYHKQHNTEYYMAFRGTIIAGILGLKQDKDGRYNTTHGTKTPLVLYRTIKRIMED